MFRQTVHSLVVKELKQTMRDKRMRFIIFVSPIFQMLLFGFALDNEVKHLPTTVYDLDNTSASREFIRILSEGGYFKTTAKQSGANDAATELLMNRAKVVVIIPGNFKQKIDSGMNSPVQLLLDGSDSNAALTATNYIRQMGQKLMTNKPPASIELRTFTYYNPDMKPKFYLVPGVFIMVLTVITTLLTAISIIKEREQGTFEQLVVSPIHGYELMAGKMIPFLIIGTIDVVLISLVAVFGFGLPFHAPLLPFILINFIYVAAMLGVGLFISTVSKTQQQAILSTFMFLFPAIILSGFMFPIASMPEPIQWLTYINPLRYGIEAERDMLLKGSGFAELWIHLVALFVTTIGLIGFGAFRFRKMLVQ